MAARDKENAAAAAAKAQNMQITADAEEAARKKLQQQLAAEANKEESGILGKAKGWVGLGGSK
jgi:hypothetical protein